MNSIDIPFIVSKAAATIFKAIKLFSIRFLVF